MTGIPFHPQMVHLPLAMAAILPFFATVVIVLIRRNKLTTLAWMLVAGLQVIATIGGYAALKTGEDDERIVRKTISKSIIHEHEERAEMFVAFSVAAMSLALATCLVKPSVQFPLMLVTAAIMVGQLVLGIRTGQSGGELVYVHRAANAHKLDVRVEGTVDEEAVPMPPSNDTQDDNEYGKGETTENDEDRENASETDE